MGIATRNHIQKETHMSLAKKHALITGSSRGIGREIAFKLAEQGANIAIHYYQNEAAARDTLAKVRAYGVAGFIIQADMTNPDSIHRMFHHVEDTFGTLDIFIHNARPNLDTFYQPPLSITVEQWQVAHNSQAQAFLVGTQAAARLMQDGGRILAITYAPSGRTGSWQPWVGMGTAKAALDALCRYFAVALGSRGITVNGISPGVIFGEANPIDGGVLTSLPPAVQSAIKDWHESGWTPLGRVGTPADIGNAALLLCSKEASFITGQILHVDGGASIMDPVYPLAIQQG
jgi:NAD(P)-dependent dehydrogenase (short-subunit alcohol dehydrogenase family)